MKYLRVLLLVLLLATPAQAEFKWEQPYVLDDPLARRIVLTATHLEDQLGPYEASVSVFSVPEGDGSRERLYVSMVDDPLYKHSRVRFWQGPVAARWQKLGPVPEYVPKLTAPNPARYRIERLSSTPSGGLGPTLMEIDLTGQPAMLRVVDKSGKASNIAEVPLNELLVNDSLRLISRLSGQHLYTSGGLSVRSYEMIMGHSEPPKERLAILKTWETALDSHLLAVSWNGNPARSLIHFLPMRPFGWKLEELLQSPKPGDATGVFVLQMISEYQFPEDNGELTHKGARYRVSVGLSGVKVKTVKTGLNYLYMQESWEP